MFQDFHSKEEWDCIIAEADPNCTSSDGITVGLGNIHIFALSNILKRPIILLDSLQVLYKSAFCSLSLLITERQNLLFAVLDNSNHRVLSRLLILMQS